MRFIKRNPIYTPEILGGKKFKKQILEVQGAAARGGQVRADIYDLVEQIRPHAFGEVRQQFDDKCAYCEASVGDHGGIDWFRPPFGAEREDGTVDQLHYVWLVGVWDNLYLCCQECGAYKKNRFPATFNARFGATVNQMRRDHEGILIDPCWDRPENFFFLDSHGNFLPRLDRAHATIQTLQLNREYLRVDRRAALGKFVEIWNFQVDTLGQDRLGRFEELLEALNHRAPFVGCLYLLLWQLSKPGTKRMLKQIFDAGPTEDTLRYLLKGIGPLSLRTLDQIPQGSLFNESDYSVAASDLSSAFRPIRKITIENFKGIRALELEMPRFTDQNFAVVGENATGKSSVLQAIALALAGPRESNRIVKDARSCLYAGEFEGRIVVQFEEESDVNELIFNLDSNRFQGRAQRSVKVFGYGPYRLLSRRETGQRQRGKSVRLHSLFDDGIRLNGYHGWLDYLNPQQRSDLAEVLQLLLISRDTQVSVNSKTLSISTNGRSHPIASLSSGMQSVVSMCTDLAEALYAGGDSVLRDGFVLIVDELDAHLHPAWRLGILARLKRAFPNAQIIFSTHDPLTLRGMKGSQIHILARDEAGAVSETSVGYSDGQSIDQMLTSPLFGLFSTKTAAWEKQYNVYVELLIKNDRNAATNAEREELRRLTDELHAVGVLGDTPRERLMFEVIDRYLAITPKTVVEWDERVLDELARSIQIRLESSSEEGTND
ncbi:AAA family ATPase [Duganella sp. Leaf61]|uniref:AAA family ATPase n=1 Tax=Duganella sp. Leaf61 TaxID=1736227 RepID=UPI0009EA8370|nr:AAA family ATPase [Duganella sp. Leaf61]